MVLEARAHDVTDDRRPSQRQHVPVGDLEKEIPVAVARVLDRLERKPEVVARPPLHPVRGRPYRSRRIRRLANREPQRGFRTVACDRTADHDATEPLPTREKSLTGRGTGGDANLA